MEHGSTIRRDESRRPGKAATVTVALGLACTDGVLVASDSMSSSGQVAMLSKKVHVFEHLPVVWTAAGTVFTIEECETALHELDEQSRSRSVVRDWFQAPDLLAIRQQLSNVVCPTMQRCYERHLPLGTSAIMETPYGPRHVHSADFLLLGWGHARAVKLLGNRG